MVFMPLPSFVQRGVRGASNGAITPSDAMSVAASDAPL
jgi:hypothetical protein